MNLNKNKKQTYHEHYHYMSPFKTETTTHRTHQPMAKKTDYTTPHTTTPKRNTMRRGSAGGPVAPPDSPRRGWRFVATASLLVENIGLCGIV